MRFQVPSRSPSPERRVGIKSVTPRNSPSNRYGLASGSDLSSESETEDDVGNTTITKLEEGEDDDDDWVSTPGSSPLKSDRPAKTTKQQWEQREFYNAVRLRQRRDPVDEYEEKQRRVRWLKAREQTRHDWQPITKLLSSTEEATDQRLRQGRKAQMEEVRVILEGLQLQRAEEEERSRLELERKNRLLWENIENSIKQSELMAKRVEEQKAREAERLQKEEEDRIKCEAEEEEARLRASLHKAKKEAVEKKRQEEEETQRLREEKERRVESEASRFKPMDAKSELEASMELLKRIKLEVMPMVKTTKARPDVQPNPDLKKEWNRLRRMIVPKIGQVTNSRSEIIRITQSLHDILAPREPHPEGLYIALLYSLSKALLHQAEEEVTAKPSTAYPLARIVIGLVALGHSRLGEIFLAKLVSMTAGWAVGTIVRREKDQSDDDYRKALGMRAPASETSTQYIDRLSGVITLYAAILQSPIPFMSNPAIPNPEGTPGPDPSRIPAAFQTPRLWSWLSRLLSNPSLMKDQAAPSVLAAILETAGDRAFEFWGRQVVKMSRMIRRKCFAGEEMGDVLGGHEGKSARLRLGLLMEKWEQTGIIAGEGRWTPEDEEEMRRVGLIP